MNAATINSLETIVRARLNLTNMATIPSADLKLFIRSSLKGLYEKIANRHRDFYVIPFQFSLAAHQGEYPLPADFRSHTEVFITSGSGVNKSYLSLEQAQSPRDFRNAIINAYNPSWPTRYRIVGKSIFFSPIPSVDYTNAIEMWYVPQWMGPPSDAATIDAQLPNGWERWAEFDTCVQIAARLRQAEYFAMFSKMRDEILPDLVAAASIRDEQPQYMVDSYDRPAILFNTPGET